MAIQSIRGGRLFIPDRPLSFSGAPNTTNVINDAVGEKIGQVFQYPKSGNVTHIEFYVTNVSGPSGSVDLDARLETLSAGLPSGTLAGTNTNVAQNVAFDGDNTWYSAALTAALAVTAGQQGAVSINVTALNGSVTNIQYPVLVDETCDNQYSTLDTGVGHVRDGQSRPMCLALRYSDGNRYPILGVLPIKTITTTTYNNGSAIRRMALRFKVPVPQVVTSFWVWMDFDADFDAILYDADGSTARLTKSCDALIDNTSAASIYRWEFPDTYTLVKDTFYYLAFVPTSATSISVYDFVVESGRLDAAEGGVDFHLATHDGTTWTTESDRRLFAGVGFGGAEDGVGGGGGLARIIGG